HRALLRLLLYLVLSHRPSPSPSCPLSLHDALPISSNGGTGLALTCPHAEHVRPVAACLSATCTWQPYHAALDCNCQRSSPRLARSEEHTSELQSRENLVCRLLLEKKK